MGENLGTGGPTRVLLADDHTMFRGVVASLPRRGRIRLCPGPNGPGPSPGMAFPRGTPEKGRATTRL